MSRRRVVIGVLGLLVPCLLVVSACADDPILGPTDGETTGGGSYSAIERLAPSGTTATPDSALREPENPERF